MLSRETAPMLAVGEQEAADILELLLGSGGQARTCKKEAEWDFMYNSPKKKNISYPNGGAPQTIDAS